MLVNEEIVCFNVCTDHYDKGFPFMEQELTQGDLAIERVRVRVLPDGRMDRENTAKYLGKKVKTLAMWAWSGTGPPFKMIGGRAYYYLDDLEAYVRGEDG